MGLFGTDAVSTRNKKKESPRNANGVWAVVFSNMRWETTCPREYEQSARGLRVIWKPPGKLASGVSGTTPILRGRGMHGRKPSNQAETSRISCCEKADHGEAGVEYMVVMVGAVWGNCAVPGN